MSPIGQENGTVINRNSDTFLNFIALFSLRMIVSPYSEIARSNLVKVYCL